MTRKKRPQHRHAGIDVSAKELHAAIEGTEEVLLFDNTPAGHKRLLKVLTKRGVAARVLVEATGAYHLDVALALARHKRCSVMVANPRMTKHFHQAQGIRAKTDKVDARSLLAFVQRMPFVPWEPPNDQLLELRATTRYAAQLVKQQTRLKNQLTALGASEISPSWVSTDIQESLTELAHRIERARQRARDIAHQDPKVQLQVEHLDAIPGIGPDTAVALVAEFSVLDREMSAKQIAAWAGLDPRPRESGTSVRGRRPISKRGNARVRAMLYMPALSVSRDKGPLGDFYRRIETRSARKSVALIAAMRKLLTVAWALHSTGSAWDENKVRPRHYIEEAA